MDNTHYAPGGTNVLLILLVPGGKKCFIDPFGPWRHKSYKRATPLGSIFHNILTPVGSHVYSQFGPWRHKCFIDLLGPWRQKMYY
jgi:hypothetical protein